MIQYNSNIAYSECRMVEQTNILKQLYNFLYNHSHFSILIKINATVTQLAVRIVYLRNIESGSFELTAGILFVKNVIGLNIESFLVNFRDLDWALLARLDEVAAEAAAPSF